MLKAELKSTNSIRASVLIVQVGEYRAMDTASSVLLLPRQANRCGPSVGGRGSFRRAGTKAPHSDGSEGCRAGVIPACWARVFQHRHDVGGFEACWLSKNPASDAAWSSSLDVDRRVVDACGGEWVVGRPFRA